MDTPKKNATSEDVMKMWGPQRLKPKPPTVEELTVKPGRKPRTKFPVPPGTNRQPPARLAKWQLTATHGDSPQARAKRERLPTLEDMRKTNLAVREDWLRVIEGTFHREDTKSLVYDYLCHLAAGRRTRDWLKEYGLYWDDVQPAVRPENIQELCRQAMSEGYKTRAMFAADELYRRGVDGVKKGVYHKGERVAEETEYSDGLLQMLLKAEQPDKYSDKSQIDHRMAVLNVTFEGVNHE